jgi:hypothetical protein
MIDADIEPALLEKIRKLPPTRRLQLEDYVDFLHARERHFREDVAESFRRAVEQLDACGSRPPGVP